MARPLEPLGLWSEPYPPSGGIAARGVKDALGRPTLELGALLMREAIQNSWDAKDPHESGPVLFGVQLLELPEQSRRLLRQVMLREREPLPDLRSVLSQSKLWGLYIYDRGTVGLAGPTRADVVTRGPQNFISFVRNVGQATESVGRTGGTYGYGKSVLYRASEAATIVVHSRCMERGRIESRLIGCALGGSYSSGRRRYTGRHWWGQLDKDLGVEPVRGALADRWASELQMPTYEGSELGTTILILAPELGELNAAAVEGMAGAAMWHCWPKIVDLGDGPAMEFEFGFQFDEEIDTPDPEANPQLRHYVAALRDIHATRRRKKRDGSEIFPIQSLRPARDLGTLAIRKHPAPMEGEEDPTRPFQGVSRHVALMRQPELVVRYMAGPESPVPGTAWSGAFLTEGDEEVEHAFAASEPPSHDDWSPAALPSHSHERRYVNIALNRIRDVLTDLFATVPTGSDGEDVPPLAQLGDALGGLIAYASGTGTRSLGGTDHAGGGGGGSRKRKASLQVSGDPEVVTAYGEVALKVTFTVTIPEGVDSAEIEAVPGVAINDGTGLEREAPLEADRPDILAWLRGGEMVPGEQVLQLEGAGVQECAVLVSLPRDVATAVELTIR
jgi:hypothetical protein